MTIDRVDWHWETAIKLYRKRHNITGPLDSEQEDEIRLLAGNHIGLFLRWIIENNMEGDDADPDECQSVRNKEMSGTEYLINNCDEKLLDMDIREDILPFIEFYYNSYDYFLDYEECCTNDSDKPLYGVISSEEDYQELKSCIDAAYEIYLSQKNDK